MTKTLKEEKAKELPATIVVTPDRKMLDAVLGKRVMRAADWVVRENSAGECVS